MLTAVAIALAFFVLEAPWSYLAVAGAAALDVAEIFLWLRWRNRTPIIGAESLVGATASVTAACRPDGQVRVRGQLWSATCAEGAEVGEDVRVREVEGNRLMVTPAG